MRANGIRRHVFVVGVAAGGVVGSVVGTAGSPAAAATSGTIPGTLTAIAVSGGIQVNQLFAGADGQMWFVTPESQLGEISTSGQATLTGVTLPHGEFPANIAAAGARGYLDVQHDQRSSAGRERLLHRARDSRRGPP